MATGKSGGSRWERFLSDLEQFSRAQKILIILIVTVIGAVLLATITGMPPQEAIKGLIATAASSLGGIDLNQFLVQRGIIPEYFGPPTGEVAGGVFETATALGLPPWFALLMAISAPVVLAAGGYRRYRKN